jgi:peptidase M1-like protein
MTFAAVMFAAALGVAAPAVDRYDLRLSLDPGEHTLSAEARIAIRNASDQTMASVPLLIYRLMDVESASDGAGHPLQFSQRVVKFSDEPSWQVNSVEVKLRAPLAPGRSATIRVKYAGPLLGYREVMQYVRDTISEDYSLIRPETMAYPIVAPPTIAGWRRSFNNHFDYAIETEVPDGFVAVCSGKDDGEPQTKNGRTTYRCAGEPGSEQMAVAVAKFRVLDDPAGHLRVYAMPADADAGKTMIEEMRRALDFYRSTFGDLHRGGGLTLIEIPDGWGSYLLPAHIFQQASAFKDVKQVPELYHEVAHIWNAKPADRVARARFFDEAFAAYFESLAVRQFQGEDAYRAHMEADRQVFMRRATRDPRGRTTPIADYGKDEIGVFSYTKGAWALYVLHQVLGEEVFRRSISEFLKTDHPVDFDEFRRSIEKTSGRSVEGWFTQWITGANDSSAMLIDGKTVEEMAASAQTR